MLTIVLVINALITLMCLYVAWKLWQIRRVLAQVSNTLNSAEQSTYNVLHFAPDAIIKGQGGTRSLRKQYRELETQLQKAQQLLALLSLGQKVWRSHSTRRKPKSSKKSGFKFWRR